MGGIHLVLARPFAGMIPDILGGLLSAIPGAQVAMGPTTTWQARGPGGGTTMGGSTGSVTVNFGAMGGPDGFGRVMQSMGGIPGAGGAAGLAAAGAGGGGGAGAGGGGAGGGARGQAGAAAGGGGGGGGYQGLPPGLTEPDAAMAWQIASAVMAALGPVVQSVADQAVLRIGEARRQLSEAQLQENANLISRVVGDCIAQVLTAAGGALHSNLGQIEEGVQQVQRASGRQASLVEIARVLQRTFAPRLEPLGDMLGQFAQGIAEQRQQQQQGAGGAATAAGGATASATPQAADAATPAAAATAPWGSTTPAAQASAPPPAAGTSGAGASGSSGASGSQPGASTDAGPSSSSGGGSSFNASRGLGLGGGKGPALPAKRKAAAAPAGGGPQRPAAAGGGGGGGGGVAVGGGGQAGTAAAGSRGVGSGGAEAGAPPDLSALMQMMGSVLGGGAAGGGAAAGGGSAGTGTAGASGQLQPQSAPGSTAGAGAGGAAAAVGPTSAISARGGGSDGDGDMSGLMQLMGGLLGGGGGAGGMGGMGGGGGMGGLLQMAGQVMNDPAMQPLMNSVASAVLGGGGGGAGGNAGGGLGSLLSGLLGGAAPGGGQQGRGGNRRSAVVTSMDVLETELPADTAAEWRRVIEGDEGAQEQQAVEMAAALSEVYLAGAPERRQGLLAQVAGEGAAAANMQQ